MRARTGLWEPWVSNHPGPPGPQHSNLCSDDGKRSQMPRREESIRKERPRSVGCRSDDASRYSICAGIFDTIEWTVLTDPSSV